MTGGPPSFLKKAASSFGLERQPLTRKAASNDREIPSNGRLGLITVASTGSRWRQVDPERSQELSEGSATPLISNAVLKWRHSYYKHEVEKKNIISSYESIISIANRRRNAGNLKRKRPKYFKRFMFVMLKFQHSYSDMQMESEQRGIPR